MVSVSLELGCKSSICVFGEAVCDFSKTAEITGVEQLDSSGNFLRDITLTDANGNVLGSAPPPVPEPPAFVLIGTGVIAARRLLARGARR
jgi:hypothetical protein